MLVGRLIREVARLTVRLSYWWFDLDHPAVPWQAFLPAMRPSHTTFEFKTFMRALYTGKKGSDSDTRFISADI